MRLPDVRYRHDELVFAKMSIVYQHPLFCMLLGHYHMSQEERCKAQHEAPWMHILG